MAIYLVAVFSDLVKSSEFWKRIPREPMAALMGEYKHLAEKVASDFGYLHLEWTGDGHFFLFQDADGAVRFGLRLVAQWRKGFDELPALQGHDPLALRVGVHFGDETELDEGGAWVGRCGNLAKRIEGKAAPDSVYVSEGLLDLIDLPLYTFDPIGTRNLKGDHVKRRALYRIVDFDQEKFAQKPTPELTANDWFLKAVAMIGTTQENTEAEGHCYEEALRLRPDYPEAHYNYAILLKQRGDEEGAVEHYKEALRLRLDYPAAHYNYANLLKERGYEEGAEEHYKEALRLRPDDPEAHNNYAILLKERGDEEGAEEHYKEALRLRPDYPEAHYNYAILLKQRGDEEGAVEHYKEALRLRLDYPAAHYNYANLLKQRGDEEEAEEHYKEALRHRPEYPDAHFNYALLLRAQQHPRKAKKHFQEAYRLDPDDPQIRKAFERQAWRKRPTDQS